MTEKKIVRRIRESLENDQVLIKEISVGFEFNTVQQPGKPYLRWCVRQNRNNIVGHEINVGGVWQAIPENVSRQIAEISAPYAVMHKMTA